MGCRYTCLIVGNDYLDNDGIKLSIQNGLYVYSSSLQEYRYDSVIYRLSL